MAEQGQDPILRIGGDASGAEDALRKVRESLTKTATAAKSVGGGIKSAFGGLTSIFSGLWSGVRGLGSGLISLARGGLSLVMGIYNKLKWAVVGVTGALAASYYAWDKEAKAQQRLDSLLKANVRNYKAAGDMIGRMVSRTQRTTNFGDDDVRGVFANFLRIRGGRGLGEASRLIPSIMDYAAATEGADPAGVAESLARALATGNVSMLRRQGIIVDQRAFKRDPMGTLEGVISQKAGGAAADQRQAAPLSAAIVALGEVAEALGSIVAKKINPYVEKFANFMLDLSNSLGEMGFKELWTVFKLGVVDAFDYFKLYGAAFFEWMQQNWPQITAGIQSTVETAVKAIVDFFKSKEFADALGAALKGAGAALFPPASGSQPSTSPIYKIPLLGGMARFRNALGNLFGVPTQISPVSAAGMYGGQGGSSGVFGGGAINKSALFGGPSGAYAYPSPFTTVASPIAGLSPRPSGPSVYGGQLPMPAQSFSQILNGLVHQYLGKGRKLGSSRALDYLAQFNKPKPQVDDSWNQGLAFVNSPGFRNSQFYNSIMWQLDAEPHRETSQTPYMDSIMGPYRNRERYRPVSSMGMNTIGAENDVVYKLLHSSSRRTDAIASERRRGALMPAY